jgi:hypothetical protein
MGSINEQSFETSTLANLSKAFEATWEVLQARDSSHDLEAAEELRLAVSGRLLELAADGVTDPVELQNRVLETLDSKDGSTDAQPRRRFLVRLGRFVALHAGICGLPTEASYASQAKTVRVSRE